MKTTAEHDFVPVRRMVVYFPRFWLKRSSTVEYKVSSAVMDIYQQANPAVIIYILLQKVKMDNCHNSKTFRDLASRGLEASRFLLQEWLLSFLTHYLAAVKKWVWSCCLLLRHKQITDTTFRTVPKLRILAKYIYTCFNSSFLSLSKVASFATLLESISTISFSLSSLLTSQPSASHSALAFSLPATLHVLC